TVLGQSCEIFVALDGSYRSEFSSSPSASQYMMVDGYGLLNARVGFRWGTGWDLFLWSRNVLDPKYFEFLTAGAAGSCCSVGLPGDPRTVGVTLRMAFRAGG